MNSNISLSSEMIDWLEKCAIKYLEDNGISLESPQKHEMYQTLFYVIDVVLPSLLGRYHSIAYILLAGELRRTPDVESAKKVVAEWAHANFRSDFQVPPSVEEFIKWINETHEWVNKQ